MPVENEIVDAGIDGTSSSTAQIMLTHSMLQRQDFSLTLCPSSLAVATSNGPA